MNLKKSGDPKSTQLLQVFFGKETPILKSSYFGTYKLLVFILFIHSTNNIRTFMNLALGQVLGTLERTGFFPVYLHGPAAMCFP
jgi:hypothetical protein